MLGFWEKYQRRGWKSVPECVQAVAEAKGWPARC